MPHQGEPGHLAEHFNPRPPRGGRRVMIQRAVSGTSYFNPRPPRGGATRQRWTPILQASISIHAPREGGDAMRCCIGRSCPDFNPRPPRGGRLCTRKGHFRVCVFQSTPPARGATLAMCRKKCVLRISIHAPREGGDLDCPLCYHNNRNFNPRPPRGGRPLISAMFVSLRLFQSTPPARGATILSRYSNDIL